VLSNQRVHSSADDPWRCRRIARQPISLVGPPRKSRRAFRFPADLASVPLLLPGPTSDIRASFDLLCDQLGIRYTLRAEVDDMALLRLLARDSGGVALLPTVVVQDELKSGALVEYAVVPDLQESFYAITVQRHFEPPWLKALLQRPEGEVLRLDPSDQIRHAKHEHHCQANPELHHRRQQEAQTGCEARAGGLRGVAPGHPLARHGARDRPHQQAGEPAEQAQHRSGARAGHRLPARARAPHPDHRRQVVHQPGQCRHQRQHQQRRNTHLRVVAQPGSQPQTAQQQRRARQQRQHQTGQAEQHASGSEYPERDVHGEALPVLTASSCGLQPKGSARVAGGVIWPRTRRSRRSVGRAGATADQALSQHRGRGVDRGLPGARRGGHGHRLLAGHRDLDPAAFVHTAVGPVDVFQLHAHLRHRAMHAAQRTAHTRQGALVPKRALGIGRSELHVHENSRYFVGNRNVRDQIFLKKQPISNLHIEKYC
jgi:hypothetical protein